ncbi:transferrin-binding protein-like solute binding protein [Sphingomonas sp. HF-S4]|uniref:Transferrin-binding protein-like solute binding protein n=1 Tax=Sphingomonas agrestis TaxID=3080540 RepID=A0ABU3Y2Y0_9SPHN|nr:transferrin-binding protein-like solute binding protein [Sphingomonas sp. HF-S4]MDV3455557.1 transferrin-binding protein-like solute binding protein [Sphingomonas sp. HF-S4]
MIRRHMIMSAAAATLALASCSGSDDPSPSPTPTPTGSVTPTPTASPTYAAFPLGAAAEFGTINASASYTGDPAAGPVTLGAVGTEIGLSTRVRLATSNAIATATYVINENSEESRFVNANVTVAPAPGVTEFVFRTTDTATAGKFSQLEFLNNTISDTTRTNNLALQLTNVSYANWWRGDSTTGAKRITNTVFGYQTTLADMPKTGTQAYTTSVVGRLVSTNAGATTLWRIGGTVTTSVNFSTGQVTATLTLNRTPEGGGATIAYGSYTLQGSILSGQNQFTGSFAAGSTLTGTLTGGFFGSQGKEIGIAFAGTGTNGGDSQNLIGVIVGKK